jgi:hypothetical protein
MLGMVPHMPSHYIPRSITVYNKDQDDLEQWPIAQFETRLGLSFCALPVCGHKYIEELMFSGFGIGETDMEFRYAPAPVGFTLAIARAVCRLTPLDVTSGGST